MKLYLQDNVVLDEGPVLSPSYHLPSSRLMEIRCENVDATRFQHPVSFSLKSLGSRLKKSCFYLVLWSLLIPCSFLNTGLACCKTSLPVFVPFQWRPCFGARTEVSSQVLGYKESFSSPGAFPLGTRYYFLKL